MHAQTSLVLIFAAVAVAMTINFMRQRGKPAEKKIFGFQTASAIYQQTKGRYDGDKSKAVPFAILATAGALDADVRVHEEGSGMIQSLTRQIEAERNKHANFVSTTEQLIQTLMERVKKNELSIEEATAALNNAVAGCTDRIGHAEKVLEFFTI